MVNLDLIRNLAILMIEDANEEITRCHSDEAEVELECIEGLKAKAEKILKALGVLGHKGIEKGIGNGN